MKRYGLRRIDKFGMLPDKITDTFHFKRNAIKRAACYTVEIPMCRWEAIDILTGDRL